MMEPHVCPESDESIPNESVIKFWGSANNSKTALHFFVKNYSKSNQHSVRISWNSCGKWSNIISSKITLHYEAMTIMVTFFKMLTKKVTLSYIIFIWMVHLHLLYKVNKIFQKNLWAYQVSTIPIWSLFLSINAF